MVRNLAYTNLLRILVWAGTTLFGLILVWQFICGIATLVLVLLLGILLAVILFWPVKELHRNKVSRILSTPLIVLGFLDLLMMTARAPNFSSVGPAKRSSDAA